MIHEKTIKILSALALAALSFLSFFYFLPPTQPFANLLNPLLGAGNYRVEAKEETDKRLSLILMIDEAKPVSSEKLDEIKQILRTASGFTPARGDVMRVIITPFSRATWLVWGMVFSFILLLALLVYAIRQKRLSESQPTFQKLPPQVKTLDDYVQERQMVAAAVFRHWLKEAKSNG